ncbi:MAG: phosphoenolpyruvate kinase [Gemmatimonadetes bacterium GWC2_71_9]|nr:MAG: phosphoenolpyruvate kinase [Gemmatimonadetes bacterium GWC2_71_9]
MADHGARTLDGAAAPAASLRHANLVFAAAHPGDPPGRQPVHVVYGGAQLFKPDTARRIGAVARRSLAEHAPDAAPLAGVFGWPAALAERLYPLVAAKLEREAVEDFRIDYEDGYGTRTDAEEDGHAVSVAEAVARGLADSTLPPFIGIRIKPLTEELRERSVRTLDLFLTALVRATGGRLPPNFVVTVPKVTIPEQLAYFATVLDQLERALQLQPGTLKFELMVETPRSIIDAAGRNGLPALVAAGAGRCVSAHFGTYDYTASLGITAAHQTMRHPACDFAKHMMQVALAGTGVWLCDGSTTVLPVGDRAAVRRAWRLHYDDVRHSLAGGFYQGWDLHPAQLVSRYAALFAFFLEGVDAAGARLKNFVAKAAQATLIGDVFDDAATGQGLLNYFLRGINCGALSEEEALALTGLTLEDLRGRSFGRIIRARR